jgi:S1-C subfamily serine protease
VITSIDGRAITSASALGPALHGHDPGDSVRVTWVDRQGTHTVTVVLIAGPAV